MLPSATFYTLLRNYSPLNEIISPQIKQIFKGYGDNVLNQFKAHWEAKNSNQPVQKLAQFFSKLDGQLKNISDPGIVQGWRSYFSSMPPSVKSETLKLLPNPTFLGKSLPSMGPVDPKNLVQTSTTPFFNVPNAKGVPVNYSNPGVRMNPSLEANYISALKLLGTIQNKNVAPAIGSVSTSKEAHGTNLVPDSEHSNRVGKIITSYAKKIQDIVGDASGFLFKSLNFNPFGVQNSDISSPPIAFEQLVEGQRVVVDGSGRTIADRKPINIKQFVSPKPNNVV